jgi:hypothetical protein
MEVSGSSKMLVFIYQTTRHHIPKDFNLHVHCPENLISHDLKTLKVKGLKKARKSLIRISNLWLGIKTDIL